MNVLFSSDDNYAPHLGVAIFSLLDNNRRLSIIRIYVVDNHIMPENIERLLSIVHTFDNAVLKFLSFDKWANSLKLKMAWPISISAYARLFAAEMLPVDLDRVLYLDCDMVVTTDLEDLWKTDLQGNCLGAVQDQVFPHIKTAIGLSESSSYFNSGLLLIDLNSWRQNRLGEKCLEFISRYHGEVIHHDQGVLNGVLSAQWTRLPLRYNVMTIHYFFSQKQMKKYFKDSSIFYTGSEIQSAIDEPVILHYTPSFTTHPWEKNCKHPLRNIYISYKQQTPWRDIPLAQYSTPWYLKIINWRYINLPY